MANIPLFLALAVCLIALLSPTGALELSSILSIQDGSTNGGCDARIATLEVWYRESEYSVDEALVAIDNYDEDERVRLAMSTFFGVKLTSKGNAKAITDIKKEIEYVKNFLAKTEDEGSVAIDRRGDRWLFCDSTFLVEVPQSAAAETYEGESIKDDKGNTVPISSIPEYAKQLKKPKNKAWWAGDRTALKGYYFTDTGADGCNGQELGFTADMQTLKKGPDGKAQHGPDTTSIVLCPYSFDNNVRPDNYREASKLLQTGTSLARAIPKSATLLHEAFHLVRGSYLSSGNAETYDLAKCINLKATDARRNPENFVFFIAHMNHLFGEPYDDEPWSIKKNWDFGIQGENRVYGAKPPSEEPGE